MFDFLNGGQATISLDVDKPTVLYLPGETIHARVSVRGDKDLKIQKGILTLVVFSRRLRADTGVPIDVSVHNSRP